MRKIFAQQQPIKKINRQATHWENFLQSTYPTNDWYLEYIKNDQNSTVKKLAQEIMFSIIGYYREIIKTSVRYNHIIHIRMAKINNGENTKC